MQDKFDTALKTTLKNETAYSENGAAMFATSGTALVDLNFATSSLRGASKETIEQKFSTAFFENPALAVQWLFFARDIRQGMGERRLFRICFSWLANARPELVKKLIPLVAEYGRFDDIFYSGLEDELWNSVVDYIAEQLKVDIDNLNAGKPFSLLAKWMPSINTSSDKTRALAKKLCKSLGMCEKAYRKNLSALRAKLNVVEVQTSANEWGMIDYNTVPSKANLKYKNAFLQHDKERRVKYLEDLENPESGAKINSAAAFPYDIIAKYVNLANCNSWKSLAANADKTLEAMWKALPDYVAGCKDGSTMCVIDSSRSMTCRVGNSNTTALDVAYSLGFYFSERLSGPFKNKYITFSYRPTYIDMSNCKTLADKIYLAYSKSEVANTDIYKTFKLILDTAVQNNLKQEDLPSNLLILSDMQFDEGTYISSQYDADKTSLMREIADMFAKYGYKMPRLVFWNLLTMGRNMVVPIQQNEAGIVLVSGFSPTIARLVFSVKLDPYEALVDMLMSERYAPIRELCKSL